MAILFESYDNSNAGFTSINHSTNQIRGSNWRTGTLKHTVTQIQLKLYTNSSGAGTTTMNLYLCDSSGKPTGASLASATLDESTVTTNTAGQYYSFNITETTLSPYSIYCAVLSSTTDNMRVREYDSGTNTVPPQRVYSNDGGSTWATDSNTPFFKVSGNPISDTAGFFGF